MAAITDASLFDKNQFNRTIKLLALNAPAKLCTEYIKNFKKYLFDRPRIRRILDIPGDNSRRLLLLDESLLKEKVAEMPGDVILPEDLKIFNNQHGVTLEYYNLAVGYEHTPMDEVLKKLLPSAITEIPSAYEQAGTIAHLNLRDEVLPYKYIIGQVIIDKVPTIKTVVNKVGMIETEYRTFPMELIGGINDYSVKIRESGINIIYNSTAVAHLFVYLGATFQFNFGEVYWNCRLQREHERLIDLITNSKREPAKKKIIVADMMAGIGPFAIPLAIKPGHQVYANDLNPASYKYLLSNTKLNHCEARLHSFNLDGRDFIHHLVDRKVFFQEVILNLPQSAVQFLDVFVGLHRKYHHDDSALSHTDFVLPRIHVYSFTNNMEQPVLSVVEEVAKVLGCSIADLGYDNSIITVSDQDSLMIPCHGHIVRDVAPRKLMICVSFTLPKSVALKEPVITVTNVNKKQRLN